jgi:hypothetical protein
MIASESGSEDEMVVFVVGRECAFEESCIMVR